MTTPVVDVIIPLHRADRRYLDALASASTAAQGLETRVTVVLHNLNLDDGALAVVGRQARVIRCIDRVPSPSGPRNIGIEHATAPFVFFLDSDDRLASNCLRHLHHVALKTGADVVLPSIRTSSGYIGTPLVPSRTGRILDVARDDLFLRSHCFALIRRSTIATAGVRFPQNIRSGEDLVFMAQLYTASRTALAFDAVYELMDHEHERVTTLPGAPAIQLDAVSLILRSDWFGGLSDLERCALVRRFLSVNLARAWRRAVSAPGGNRRDEFSSLHDLALAECPGAERLLSLRDRWSLHFEEHPSPLERCLQASPFAAIPTTPIGAVNRHGPVIGGLRRLAVRRRARRAD